MYNLYLEHFNEQSQLQQTERITIMKYWFVAYILIEKPNHNTTHITHGNHFTSGDLHYLSLKKVIQEIKKRFPNGTVAILNFQEISKDAYDELFECDETENLLTPTN